MLLYILLGDLDRPPGLIAGQGARKCCNGKFEGNRGRKCWVVFQMLAHADGKEGRGPGGQNVMQWSAMIYEGYIGYYIGDLDRPPGLSGPGDKNVMQSRVRFESYLFASIIRPIIFVVSDHALNRFESEDVARYRRRTWHLWC